MFARLSAKLVFVAAAIALVFFGIGLFGLAIAAALTPDDLAFAFTDYDQVWEGVTDSLTWSQLYRRTLNLADELSRLGPVRKSAKFSRAIHNRAPVDQPS